MKPLRFLRDYPMAIAVVLVLGFAAWLAYDACKPPNYSPPPLAIGPNTTQVHSPRPLPENPALKLARSPDPSRPGLVTADLITRLHPGMARVEVEELIGTPPAELVHPVANVNGRFTYRASYLANLEKSHTTPGPGAISAAPPPRSMIGVEYDASRPGHPLVKVHIPDPMS
ncbi:MAG TPA: hypothetical protein VGL71_09675 [Urbifossiella sp.]|jgi:hypothetical protein